MDNDCPCCAKPWGMSVALSAWTHLKIDDASQSVQWIGDHGAALSAIAINPDATSLYINGNAAASPPLDDMTLRKLDLNGGQIWAQHYPSLALAVAPNGDVFTSKSEAFLATTYRRTDSNGDLIWEFSRNAVRPAVFDSTGQLYTVDTAGLVSQSPPILRFFDTTGTETWNDDYGVVWGNNPRCVTTNGSQVVAVGSRGASGFPRLTTRAVDPTGVTLIWSADHGATVNAAAFMSNGYVVTAGAVSSGVTTRCYDSSGVQQWTVNHGAEVQCVAIDASDNVYTGGVSSSSVNVRKYNSSGTLQWSFDYSRGRAVSSTVFGVCVDNAGYVYLAGSRVSV